jgi:FHA domain
MSGDAFTGLRPIAKRLAGSDLNRKTKRIVLPSSTDDGPAALPSAIDHPPRIVPIPKPVIKKRFSLVPVSPALLEIFPQGILLTPGWTFIGSNPSMELPAFTALILNLEGISKVHAAVTEFNGIPFVTDLGSTNGTRIFRDQKAIEVTAEPVELHPGDILWMGSVFFHVMQS